MITAKNDRNDLLLMMFLQVERINNKGSFRDKIDERKSLFW